MEPVVNPWVFYFIEVADSIKIFAFLVLFAALAYIAIRLICIEEVNVKKIVTICCICFALIIFVPTSDTVLKMLIADNITYDVVDEAKDIVSRVYSDIMALFQK